VTLDGQWDSLSLSDGSTLEADQYVFACGPWLGKLFPEVVAIVFVPPSRTYSSLARPPEMTGSPNRSCRSGLIIATGSSMAFPAMKEEASNARLEQRSILQGRKAEGE